MAVVIFDPTAFKLAYPAFAAVPDAQLQNYFSIATLYLSNQECSPVQDIAQRTALLWMLTAHIAYLNGAISPGGVAPPVGRVAGATEGSVSITLDFMSRPGSAQWFNQTPWGAMFWQATLSLRSFRYRARPTRY